VSQNFTTNRLIITGLCLLAVGVLISYTARFVFQYPYYCPTDETTYLRIINILLSGEPWPVSGPGFVDLNLLLGSFFGLGINDASLLIGFIVSSIYPLTIFILYRILLKDDMAALFAVLSLIMSSYFLAPMLESRPQQIGCLLLTVTVFLLVKKDLDRNKIVLTGAFILITLYYHLLSFLILIGILSLYLYTEKKPLFKNNKLIFLVLMTFVGIILATILGLYEVMLQDILKNQLNNWPLFLSFLLLIFFLAILLRTPVLYVSDNVISCFESISYRAKVSVVFSLFTMAGFIQLLYLPEGSLSSFKDSSVNFFTLEFGNAVFGILFVFGFCLRKGEIFSSLEIMRKLSFLILIMGFFSLVMSFYMLNSNWMIRMINYWIIFAAPFAAVIFQRVHQCSKLISIPLMLCCLSMSMLHAIQHPVFMSCSF